MSEKQIQLAEGTQLTLAEVAGDLKLIGWEESYVLVRGDSEEDLSVETGDGIRIVIRTDGEVSVPARQPITVGQAMGTMKARDLQSELTIGQVHGDLKLIEVGSVTVDCVHGNLKAEAMTSLHVNGPVHGDAKLRDVRQAAFEGISGNLRASDLDELRAEHVGGDFLAHDVQGDVTVEHAGGNAILRDVTGAVQIERAGGDFVGRDLTGGVHAPNVGGSLALSGELGQGTIYQFAVGGDAMLNLDEEASADLNLKAGGRVQSALTVTDQQRTPCSLTGRLGDGGVEVTVEAGGNIILGRSSAGGGSGDEAEFGRLGAQLGQDISRQVEESLRSIDMEAIGRKANEEIERAMSRLRAKLEGVDWERLGVQAQVTVERSMAQMQREIDRLAARAARQQERAARAAERQQHRSSRVGIAVVDWEPGRPSPAPERAAERPSFDEERLSILKMLEQGQITLEEAETLLDALK